MIGWVLRSFAVGVLFLVIHGASSLAGGMLPWWGSLLAAVATYFAAAFALKSLLFRAMTAPFKMKGAVLRGAKLVVHSVQAIAAPVKRLQPAMAGGGGEDECEGDDGGDDCPAGWRWYCIDATVTPPGLGEGPFRCWAPGELGLVAHDADTSPKAPTDDGMAVIKGCEIFDDGAWTKDEGMSFEGERRIRLTVACAPELAAAKLRYYFESVGRIDLPR